MTIPNRDEILAELESLGPDEVRERFVSGVYATNKAAIVEAWLAEQKKVTSTLTSEKTTTLTDRYITRLKNHRPVAILLIVVAVIGGIAQFTDAISKIAYTATGLFHPSRELPTLPGDSGWLLLGDLDPKGERYIRGPFFLVERSAYPEKFLTPRKGEQLRLLTERNLVIAGYKVTGIERVLTPPWTLNVLSDRDYTGIKLSKDSVVEVRDVSLASFPGEPLVLWVRIGPPPK
ncbi:hypothetical protein [Pseudomonas fluorescens]|uniref:hypothetical protein n=1 Tax=Pseudomonas fluorescens TaxID=294 RepID=UPI003D0226C5